MGKYLAVTYDRERVYTALVRNGAVAGAATGLIMSAKNSGEAISTAVRETAAKHGLKTPESAMTLPDRDCLTKRLDGTQLTEADLLMNLPYEFGDYIRTGMEADYKFDYQVVYADKHERRILAVAVLRSAISEAVEIATDAATELSRLVPETCALGDLIETHTRGLKCAVITVGGEETMIRLYAGAECYASHEINFGVSMIREELQNRNLSFFEGAAPLRNEVLEGTVAREESESLAMNVLSALDYFREEGLFFPEMPIYFAGEGALVPRILRQIAEGTGAKCETVAKLIKGTIDENLAVMLAPAIGAAIER